MTLILQTNLSTARPETHPIMQGKAHKERLLWVDYARGMAILLVVYRHAVVGLTRSGLEVPSLMYNLQEVVFSFRMPVFFVLSGIFLAASLRKHKVMTVVKDKASTLLYPYLLWATITVVLQIFFTDYSNASRHGIEDIALVVTQPRAVAHLWYLLALFNTSMLFLLLRGWLKNDWIHLALALVLHYLSTLEVFRPYSIIRDLFYFYPFLFIGTRVSKYLLSSELNRKYLDPKHLVWLLPIFLVGQYFWFTHKEMETTYLFLFFLIILIGCYFFYIIAGIIAKFPSMGWLAYLGKNSLYIYILHIYIVSFSRSLLMRSGIEFNIWVLLLVSWACGVIVPVFLYNLFKQIGFRKLFTLKQQAGT